MTHESLHTDQCAVAQCLSANLVELSVASASASSATYPARAAVQVLLLMNRSDVGGFQRALIVHPVFR